MPDMNNPTDTAPDMVEVIQADRDAAAGFYGPHLARPGEVLVTAHMRAGKIDESPLILAFARHRAQSEAPLRAEVERLREALEPFAVIGRAIKAAARDSRWLEQVLFYAGTDTDPSSMSLTGRAFDRAAAALESRSHGEAGR